MSEDAIRTITPFGDVDGCEPAERSDASVPGFVVYPPTLFIVRVKQPTPLEAALERALCRAMTP